jgi:integrase
MILIAFRHGLRAAEVCDLRWDQVDLGAAVLHVRRVKNGTPSTHPLHGDELRALRRLQRESPPSPFVFVSERGTPPPFRDDFARVRGASAGRLRSVPLAVQGRAGCQQRGRPCARCAKFFG